MFSASLHRGLVESADRSDCWVSIGLGGASMLTVDDLESLGTLASSLLGGAWLWKLAGYAIKKMRARGSSAGQTQGDEPLKKSPRTSVFADSRFVPLMNVYIPVRTLLVIAEPWLANGHAHTV